MDILLTYGVIYPYEQIKQYIQKYKPKLETFGYMEEGKHFILLTDHKYKNTYSFILTTIMDSEYWYTCIYTKYR